MRLKDKVAIITGAGRGIGQATAIKFAREGAKVMVCDINQEWIDETVRQCKAAGSDAIGQIADVRDMKSLEAMVKTTVDKWGRIDCLVNNAGIVADAQLKNMTEDQFDRVIDINLKGVYNCTKAVVHKMLEQQSGVILNASSIVGLYGNFGQTNYAAAKAGMHGFTKSLSLEVARKGVTVNTISPGYIGTKMVTAIPKEILDSKILPQIPVGRLGKPEEIAGLIIYLCSEEAAFVNGANIAINGGQHMQ